VGERVELVAGVALARGDGLLSPPRLRRLREVTLRHLHVPTEHPRVAKLQRRDLTLLAEAPFELDDEPLPVAREHARLVELLVVAVAKDSAVARAHRRLVDDRLLEQPMEVRAGIDELFFRADLQRLARALVGTSRERLLDGRQLSE